MTITQTQLNYALALRDLTNPAMGQHAMQQLIIDITDSLQSKWQSDRRTERGQAVVPVSDNYDRLYYPTDGVARDKRYTRYVTDDGILRTQMSAVIPNALQQLTATDPDTLLVCPGLVYRRDVKDSLHVAEPHQLDLWRICYRQQMGDDDLSQMIDLVVAAVLPTWQYRKTKTKHPYTLNGIEVEVLDPKTKTWVEVGECGLALPQLLTDNGLDSKQWSGLAMGLGLDRLLMLRKGINDIRLLRSNDPRVVSQMQDLNPYKEVSTYPPVKRDISIAVSAGILVEELTEQLEAELSNTEWEMIEAVELISQTPAKDLPIIARQRIGLGKTQDNVLLRA